MTVDLFVFDSRPDVVRAVAGADADHRADAVVVDWERTGKVERQANALDLFGIETQIGPSTPADLAAVVATSAVPVICRIDAWHGEGPADLERAIEHGAAEVILPMVRTRHEVVDALATAAGRIRVGVMIETVAACEAAAALAALPISRAYLGLMDLALERETTDIFTALRDGTLDHVAGACAGVPFGFAGLTVPGRGRPVPTVELAERMVRIGAAFTFLRRSFFADAGADLPDGLRRIRGMLAELQSSPRRELVR